jgi:hypothetical protein
LVRPPLADLDDKALTRLLRAVARAEVRSRARAVTDVQWRVLLALKEGALARSAVGREADVDDSSLGHVLGLLARSTRSRHAYIKRSDRREHRNGGPAVWCLTPHGRDLVRNRVNHRAALDALNNLMQALDDESLRASP